MIPHPVHFLFFLGRFGLPNAAGFTFTSFRISASNFPNPLGFLLMIPSVGYFDVRLDETRRKLRDDCYSVPACLFRPIARMTWAHFVEQHFCRLRFRGFGLYFAPHTSQTFSSG